MIFHTLKVTKQQDQNKENILTATFKLASYFYASKLNIEFCTRPSQNFKYFVVGTISFCCMIDIPYALEIRCNSFELILHTKLTF